MMDMKQVLFKWFINSLIKEILVAVLKMRIFLNKHPLDLATQEFAEELHKPIISKFKKRKVQ